MQPTTIPDTAAWELYERLRPLGSTIYWEPSLKLLPGRLVGGRCLLSLPTPWAGALLDAGAGAHASSAPAGLGAGMGLAVGTRLGALPGGLALAGPTGGPTVGWTGGWSTHLWRLLAAQGLPAACHDALQMLLPDACFVHFGIEHDPPVLLRKFYLEFPRLPPRPSHDGASVAAEAATGVTPPLLYLAIKWDPAQPGRHLETRYLDHSATTAAQLGARIATILGPSAPTLVAATNALLDQALRRLVPERITLVEVLEAGNPRRSLDLGVYGSGLRLADLGDWLTELCTRFVIDAAGRAALADIAAAPLGNFAAGIGRDGQPFCGLYYGAGRLQRA